MLTFDIAHLFPRFLLNDKNGYAMAKAIERAMQIFCEKLQTGVDTVLDIEKMPEWRLDEMAWEMACLYDYEADVESKRAWIRDAVPIFASFGTVEALYNVLAGYFDAVEVEENWQYGAPPYHFRITVSGKWTDRNEAWAISAVDKAKNVRSILDDIAVGSTGRLLIGTETQYRRFPYGMTGTERMTGTRPTESTLGGIQTAEIRVAAEDADGYRYPYTPVGTTPQENIAAAGGEGQTMITGEAAGSLYAYPQTGETVKAGTIPEENTVGAAEHVQTRTQSDGTATVFSYRAASGNTPCGSNEPF